MEIVRTVRQLGVALKKHAGSSLGFVPTMGALHAGHISLVERARRENDAVVVSIFVNPNQFNDPSDLKNYPRTPHQDEKMLDEAGADILFAPSVDEIYPEPDTRRFEFGNLDTVMEGATRPGHFNGVAQVVSRLFDLVKPDRAYFGEKDLQQIAVIRDLMRQTGNGTVIVECPIVREQDGLAMSSRNALLPPEYREAAPRIYQALKMGVAMKGSASVDEVHQAVISHVEESHLLKVIYFEIVDSATLQPVDDWGQAGQICGCIAVQAGPVRLIDNIRF